MINVPESLNNIQKLEDKVKEDEHQQQQQQQLSSCEFIFVDDDSNDSLIDQKIDQYRHAKHGSESDLNNDSSLNINEQVNVSINKNNKSDCDVNVALDYFKQNHWKTEEDNELKENKLKQLLDISISGSNKTINNKGNIQMKEDNKYIIPLSDNINSRNSNGYQLGFVGQLTNLDTLINYSRGSMNYSHCGQKNIEDLLFHTSIPGSLDNSLSYTDDIWQKQLKINTNAVKYSQLRASNRNPLDITLREQQILQKKKNNNNKEIVNNNINIIGDNNTDSILKQVQQQQYTQLSPIRIRNQSSNDCNSSSVNGFQNPNYSSLSPCKKQTNKYIKQPLISPPISISVQPQIQSPQQTRFSVSYHTLDNQQFHQNTKLIQSPKRPNINTNYTIQTNPHSLLSYSELSSRQYTIPTPSSNKSVAQKHRCLQVHHPSPLRSIISQKQRNLNKQLNINSTIYISNQSGNTFIQNKQDTNEIQGEQDQIDFSNLPTTEDRSRSSRRRRSSSTCHKIGYSSGISYYKSDSNQFYNKGLQCSTESTKNISNNSPVYSTHSIFQGNQAFQINQLIHNKQNSNYHQVLHSNLNNSSLTTPQSTSIYKKPSQNCSIFSNGIFSICENNILPTKGITEKNQSFIAPSPRSKNRSSNSTNRTNQQRQFSNESNKGKFKLYNLFIKNQLQPNNYRSKSQLNSSSDRRKTTSSPAKGSRTPKSSLINCNYLYFPQHPTLSPKISKQQENKDDRCTNNQNLPQLSGLHSQNETSICMSPTRSVSQSRVSNRTSRYRENQQYITESSSRTLEPRQMNYSQNQTINKWAFLTKQQQNREIKSLSKSKWTIKITN